MAQETGAVSNGRADRPAPTSGAVMGRIASEMVRSAGQWWFWGRLGWYDIRQRYRGSMLGPLWSTISMAVSTVALGLFYGFLLGMELAEYIPFLCLGLILWGFLSALLTEAPQVFISNAGIIRESPAPIGIYVFQLIWRNMIVLGHNMIVFLVVALVFGLMPTASIFLVLPGMALVLINGIWLTLLLGMSSAKYRDVAQMTNAFLQLLFFMTPILWKPTLLGPWMPLVYLNPFASLLAVVRDPLIGAEISPLPWLVCTVMAVLGWSLALFVASRLRRSLVLWT
ncbi:ABC transporter permease [Fulvimarina sp. MAC3]|uniref:ABC transporter permease n=1 Tax=Fulvimarina sp. MAC3 TaxID=3148887 RepID=UPI0031FC3775